jgi:hypothetical protein
MKTARLKLPLRDALRVRSAELWLLLGEPVQALLELQKVTKRAWKDPWTVQVFERVTHAMG